MIDVSSWSGKTSCCILSLLFLCVIGCDRDRNAFDITGTVTYQGKPLKMGIVVFTPEKGRPLDPVRIDENGVYRIQAMEGNYCVAVIAKPEFGDSEPGKTPEESVGPVRSLIPERYGNPRTSGISVKVEAGGQSNFNFPLL